MKRIILALAILCTPAHAGGKTEILKTESCVAGAAVKVIETQPSILVVQRVVMAWVKAEKEKRMASRCKMPGRVWHEGKCWLPGRIPRS